MEAILVLLCLLLVYVAHTQGWIKEWAPVSRVAGFWGTLDGDLYEVKSGISGLEVISNGKVQSAKLRFPRQLCLIGSNSSDCGRLSLDGRIIYWDGAEKWVRQGV